MKTKLKDELVVYLTEEEINSLICDLCEKVEEDYADKDLMIISTLKGTVPFVSDFVQQIQKNISIDFIHLKKRPQIGVQILRDISLPMEGKHVLIVQQIVDKGSSLEFLRHRIETANPASIKILTLLDRPSRREASLFPDYVGQTVDDRFLVGYGLDWKELGRNYPHIYQLKQ